MNRRYTPDELRSKLSQYANAHIDHIACSEDYIYIRFKEGYGSTYGESFSQEIYVTTIKEMKEACKKSNLIPLADWCAQEAVDEITEAFVEEKALESAIAEHQAEFEDTHPDLLYMKEKYNELSKEARHKIDNYAFELSCGPLPINQLKRMYIKLKDGLLNDYQAGRYGEPQDYLLLTFEELEQGKLIEATESEHFIELSEYKKKRFQTEITLGPYVSEDETYMTAIHESPKESILMESTIHRVPELTQTVKVRNHG